MKQKLQLKLKIFNFMSSDKDFYTIKQLQQFLFYFYQDLVVCIHCCFFFSKKNGFHFAPIHISQ